MSEHPAAHGAARQGQDGGGDCPRRRPDAVCEPLDDTLVLYQPGSEYGHILNRSAAFIWMSCDGSRSVADLICAVMTEYGIDHERANTDVSACLARLRARGLLVDADAEESASADA